MHMRFKDYTAKERSDLLEVGRMVYDRGGVTAVLKLAELVSDDRPEYCEPCDTDTPHVDGYCLACWHHAE